MDALGINLPTSVVWLAYAIYFALFGGGSAIIASRKGLNGYLAFILGAALGPIGLVIVLIIPRKNKVTS